MSESNNILMKLFLFISFVIIFSSCCKSTENTSNKPLDVSKANRQSIHCNDTTILNDTLIDIFHIEKQKKERAYDLIINDLINKYKHSNFLKAADIECVIPRTKTEFFIYYRGYQKENKFVGHELFYHYCDSLFSLYAIRDSLNIFYFYLNLYQIIDCKTISESYCTNVFNRIEDAIYANKQKYDKLYLSFDQELKNTYDCFNWE